MRAFGVALGASVAIGAAGCGGSATAGGISEDDYVRANERLVERLPRLPGARETARTSAPYYASDDGGAAPAGYTTNVVYELPARVGQRAVVDFYVARMDGWRPALEHTPGVDLTTGEPRPGAWVVTLTHLTASVHVNTDNLIAPAGRRFEVSVDHRGARSQGGRYGG